MLWIHLALRLSKLDMPSLGLFKWSLFVVVAQLIASPASAAQLRVAVASNFAATAHALVEEYSLLSDDSITVLVGSTGKHTSQIRYGLKADVFLAADSVRPKLLEESGFAIMGSRFTYAVGRLALWSPDASSIKNNGIALMSPALKHVAVANPKIAPYGVAAKQVLSKLDVAPMLVYGESVGQAFQFASSGSAELALVAYAQIKNLNSGSFWLVPDDLHQTIEQQAVALNNTASTNSFMRFLKSDAALELIESHGYLRP